MCLGLLLSLLFVKNLIVDHLTLIAKSCHDRLVPDWVLCQNESFEVRVCISCVENAFEFKVGSVSTHSLNNRLRCAEVPEFKTGRRVQVSVNRTYRQVIAFVTSAAKLNDVDRPDLLSNPGHVRAEMLKGGRNPNVFVGSTRLIMIKGLKILGRTFQSVCHRHRLVVFNDEGTVFSRAEIGCAFILIFRGEWLMNHTDSAVASDAEPDQHSASWEVLFDKI